MFTYMFHMFEFLGLLELLNFTKITWKRSGFPGFGKFLFSQKYELTTIEIIK